MSGEKERLEQLAKQETDALITAFTEAARGLMEKESPLCKSQRAIITMRARSYLMYDILGRFAEMDKVAIHWLALGETPVLSVSKREPHVGSFAGDL